MDLFANAGLPLSEQIPKATKTDRSGAFTDNMKLPVHRWFRYSAGFSAKWVESVIEERSGGKALSVLDPFCGSGTTLLAASAKGADAVGFESHPFVARIAKAKTQRGFSADEYLARSRLVLDRARETIDAAPRTKSVLLRKCYSDEALIRLEAIRDCFLAQKKGDLLDDLIWLALTSILRECSGVGTAQWQYLLPNRTKAKVVDPFVAFDAKANMVCADLLTYNGSGKMSVVQTDARDPSFSGLFDLVITSPPYPNNYDYADATRLEMTFWEEISGWGDLQPTVRKYLVRACSQHSAAERLVLDDLLSHDEVAPIRDELLSVCKSLDEMRGIKAGKKTYHTMVAAYFFDLARVWKNLRKFVKSGGEVAFVIGDSAPYGVYIPCDKWLSELAVAAGFHSPEFRKLRDRNVKWKNRKHQVPLQEGVLWLKG